MRPGGDLALLNRELAAARARERVVAGDKGFAWEWERPAPGLARMLWPVVRSVAELLTSPALVLTRECQGEDCGSLFLDTSRNRTRCWCDMSDCGNLAKVRRFRRRRFKYDRSKQKATPSSNLIGCAPPWSHVPTKASAPH